VSSEVIELDKRALIVCSSLSGIKTIYALIASGKDQHVDGCWSVDAKLRVIVLQFGKRVSSITYSEFRGEAVIARMIKNGAPESVINRVRDKPWTPWYSGPAWVFTQWLSTEEKFQTGKSSSE
jgi:hypothetical protein